MDEVYHQSFLKKLSNNLKLLTKQFRKVLSNEQKKEINTRRLIVQLAFLMKKKHSSPERKKMDSWKINMDSSLLWLLPNNITPNFGSYMW